MIVLSESTPLESAASASTQEIAATTEMVKLLGCRVYSIPKDFSQCENAENALWHIPTQEKPMLAIWTGYIPSAERYAAIYDELLRKKIHLPNIPEEHLTAQEFDRAYPRLIGLTPESITLTEPALWQQAGEKLGYPVFVRGTARSRKAAGWKACVATGPEELRLLVEQLFQLPYRARGRVIVRRLVNLRHSRFSDDGFPLGREYRVFLFRDQVLGFGYYWEGDDPLRVLDPEEERAVLMLAVEASHRMAVPFVCVDIGQLDDKQWIVIEIGDPQFAGTSQMPLLPLWKAILGIEEHWHPS